MYGYQRYYTESTQDTGNALTGTNYWGYSGEANVCFVTQRQMTLHYENISRDINRGM